MSETTDTDGKKSARLSRPGRLELRKTVEAGQVRQSFSHGRTKAVTVEVKKKRTFTRGVSGRMAEVDQIPGAAAGADSDAAASGAGSGLTGEERAARERALLGAGPREAGAPAPGAGADVAAPPLAGAEPGEAVPALEQPAADADKGRLDDEEARRLAQQEVRVGLTESQVKPLVAPAAPAKTPKPAPPPDTAEERRPKRARPEGRKPGPGARRQEPRRRAGKMTVTEALSDDGDERTRSLAAVRRQREREKQQARAALKESKKVIREVVVPETITVQELSNRMAERGADVIKTLMNMGVMVTINQTIDADTAELVIAEFGHRIRRRAEADVEIGLGGIEDDTGAMVPRAPVVTVMGHVDHGKTSLLDALRETDVAAREAGGITQHIGAYQVELGSGDRITFLDTPGHEAFTAMRSRGARATDIVVLVVAADDGIQPQTVEAINHAQAAGVPIIVAVNKIDRPDADPSKVRNELLQHEIVPEEMGGEVICVDVSALKKTNLDKLEETIVLQAEVLELAANPDRPAQGVVVEAKVDRGRGPVATVLVQRGTLRVGDILIAGSEWGRVRALVDDHGGPIAEAGPSVPVEVLGLSGAPLAGDDFAVVENDVRAREITEFRTRQMRQKSDRSGPHSSVEQFIAGIKMGELSELPAVIKADVQGSVEAISAALQNLSTDEVAIRLLHTGVGGINESDITLAQASGALVIGFNVRANPQARDQAESQGIDIRYYSVIYDIIDDVKALLSGMLSPEMRENYIGNAEIREVFNITKTGKVAGCMVTRGVVRRGAGVRLLRDDVVIHEGKLGTLKRFKDEVKEVKEGVECGMAFERYQDIRVGDVIECYETEEIARTL